MSKTVVISTRLTPDQEKRLARQGRQLGRSTSEVSALLIEEGLRRNEFAFIEFRNSPVGRQACIQGSTLAVWEVVWIARSYKNNVSKTSEHLCMSSLKVQAALNYAEAFPSEIDEAINDNESIEFSDIKRMLPQARLISVAGNE